jgi:hypothetical protein
MLTLRGADDSFAKNLGAEKEQGERFFYYPSSNIFSIGSKT